MIDGLLEHSPAEHVRRPAAPAESPTLGFTHLQFEALLTAAASLTGPVTSPSSPCSACVTAAGKVNVDKHGDELHDGVAGEFAFDDAKLHYYQALTLNDACDPDAAERAAAIAISLYQAVPARARSYGCDALARVQLARAQLMSEKLEDAAQALAGVLTLDPQLRIGSLAQHLQDAATC